MKHKIEHSRLRSLIFVLQTLPNSKQNICSNNERHVMNIYEFQINILKTLNKRCCPEIPILWVWRVRARCVSLWPAAHVAIGTSLFWTSWARCSTCILSHMRYIFCGRCNRTVLTIPILETALLGEYERKTGFRRLVRRPTPMTSRIRQHGELTSVAEQSAGSLSC